jgi:hypothetical protein
MMACLEAVVKGVGQLGQPTKYKTVGFFGIKPVRAKELC